MANDESNFKFFHYGPSLAAAVIFIILFFATTAMHAFQMLRRRAWLMIPFFIGGCFELIGYVARAIASRQTPNWTLGPFIVNTILVLVAPALFAASIYMLLGRIILLTGGEPYSVVRRRWLTKVFVGGDVLSFLMQSSGGGIMAGKTKKAIDLGQNIVVGGLVVQILFFGFFLVVAAIFHLRIHRSPTAESRDVPWKRHINILYAASILILIRSIFRVVEYRQGNDGYLLGHEVFLYIFDAVLMLGVMVLFNLVHPSEISTLLRRGNVLGQSSQLNSITNVHENAKGDRGEV
ncbi:MAG: hypothetical protein Q9195_006453 [Heterodermia aff. obscurata]